MHDVKSENFHERLELGLKLGLALVSIKPKSANLANRKNCTGIIHTITILTANRILQLWQKRLLTAEHVKRVSPSEYRNKVDDHII